MDDDITVRDNPDASRYEIRVGDRRAGVAVYRLDAGRIVFEHTEIDPNAEGKGLGGRLAAGALEDARSRGLDIVAECPFIADYIEHHPEVMSSS